MKNAIDGKTMINIVKKINEGTWNSFFNKFDEATIYHKPEWKQFLEKTFGYKSEYIFAKEELGRIVGILLEDAIELFQKLNFHSLEIKDTIDDNRFVTLNSSSTHILKLSSNPENVWLKLKKGSVRLAKKAEKSGVSIETTRDRGDLKEIYGINAMTKRDLGIPCHL